jgi:hypothetical protein
VERFKKINKGITQLVVPALAIAVIGALSVFIFIKWMQKPVEGSNTAPTATRALTAQPGTAPAVQVSYSAAKPTGLEILVAPIALYPDLLLAQLLPASTYPLEVVQAAHWLESKPYLAQVSDQGWAPAIIELLRFPQLIFMMNEKLDWTAELGDRFLAEPYSVLAAIQSMRARAMNAGLLKDSAEQKVTKATVTKVAMGNKPGEGTRIKVPAASEAAGTRQIEVIRIEPANPQIIHVPQYNPQVLYAAPPAPDYYPDASPTPVYDTTTSQASPWLTYGAGVATDALLGWAISEWNDDDWDDHYHGYYRPPYIARYSSNYNGYRGGADNINIYRDANISGNEINVNRNNTLNRPVPAPWVHDPLHRHGYRYSSQAQQHLGVPKQQPALAGQRRAAGQVANPDYAGYDRDKLEPIRQTEVEKTPEQGIASIRKQQHKATQQNIATSLNQTDKKPGVSQQPVQQRTKAIPHSASASNRTVEVMNFTDHDSGAYSVFSDVRAGSQAQTFSKRGLASRTEGRIGATHDSSGRK